MQVDAISHMLRPGGVPANHLLGDESLSSVLSSALWKTHRESVHTDKTGQNSSAQAEVSGVPESSHSLHLAGEVQKRFFPDLMLSVQGLDIAGRSCACDTLGGDLLELICPESDPGKEVSVVVGDVSGHGPEAALLAARVSGFIRMGALQRIPMTQTVSAINDDIARSMHGSGLFVTLFYLTFSSDRRSIEWVRAGHETALVYDPCNDVFHELRGDGMSVGVKDDWAYSSYVTSNLGPGQVLVVGTDGICESINGRGEMFGRERMKRCIRRHAPEPAQTILEAVVGAHAEFVSGACRSDDMTLVIAKITDDISEHAVCN